MRSHSHLQANLVLSVLLALGLFATACTGSDGGEAVASSAETAEAEPEPEAEADFGDAEPQDETGAIENDLATDDEPTPGPDVFPGGDVDFSKTRDDVDCTAEGLGDDDTVDFSVAHVVVGGDLGEVCFGESDPRLVRAWETLATITPSGQLNDLALFGGFASAEDGDETTLAFVNTLDDAGSVFQMSVNLDEGDADPNELILTMAHEFSHVFTALSTEIDRNADPDDCETFYSGDGCYLPESLMAEWIDVFWGNGLIDQIDPFTEASAAGGEERCFLNAGFFGPYAASSPEEDFAESFSAFVFRLEVDSDEQEAKMNWFADQPGLLEFQQLAIDADLGPLPNNFEYCGE